MSDPKALKSSITIGSVVLDTYTLGESCPETGKFVNYFSGRGLAESIGLVHSTTVKKRLSAGLKGMLGEGFTTTWATYKMESGGTSRLNLWHTTDATKYYLYHAMQGNVLARQIMEEHAGTTLDIMADDSFGRVYVSKDAEKHTKARLAGQVVQREWTDAVQLYCDTEEVTDFYKTYIYLRMSDAINMGVFSKTTKQLCVERNVKKADLRNSHSEEELKAIADIENLTMKLIDNKGFEPMTAVNEAVRLMT